MFEVDEEKKTITMNAILGSQVEKYLKNNGCYGPFEDGSASCYFCKTGLENIGQMGMLLILKKRDQTEGVLPIQYVCKARVSCIDKAREYTEKK